MRKFESVKRCTPAASRWLARLNLPQIKARFEWRIPILKCGRLRGAVIPRSYPHEPLVSYRINRQLSGWNLPPLVIRAFGAHCHNRTLWLYSRGVNEAFFAELSAWLAEAGLAGTSETDIVSGFCDRCVAAGLPLAPSTRAACFVGDMGPLSRPCSNMAAPARRRSLHLVPNPTMWSRRSAGGTAHTTRCYKWVTRFCAAA